MQVILSIIFQVEFSRSHHNNRWAKLLTTFLRAQGISAKSLDLLHSFALTMCHKWSSRAFGQMSSNELTKLRDMVQHLPFVITHDNVNIPFAYLHNALTTRTILTLAWLLQYSFNPTLHQRHRFVIARYRNIDATEEMFP